MSITKGAMLISNANAVGTELVNQLGGTGYKPVEWADAINLLGISNDDKASALAGITEGAYTGDERGSIKYSNCNAVGSMLNKKFSTDRGFKPVEWESAISKLTPLAEGTVSGSVVSIENGADDVPTKSLIVTISPTLDGVSSVSETQTGRNLLNDSIRGANGANIFFGHDTGTQNDFSVRLRAGTYTFSVVTADGTITNLYVKNSDTNTNITGFPAYGVLSKTFTLTEDTNCAVFAYKSGYTDVTDILTAQIEYGSTAHDYEPYTTPTQYTANLGRTIYGGTADIVNGTGTDENGNDFTFDGQEINTRLGYNAFWSDSGDTEVTYRKDPDIPDQPVQLLDMNNNENNDN